MAITRSVFIWAVIIALPLTDPALADTGAAAPATPAESGSASDKSSMPPELDKLLNDKTLPQSTQQPPAMQPETPVQDATADSSDKALKGTVEESEVAGFTTDSTLRALDPKMDCMSFIGRSGRPVKLEISRSGDHLVDGTYWETTSQGYPWISKVYRHMPAEKAGVEEGDQIIELNGRSTYNLDPSSIWALEKLYDPETTTEMLGLRKKGGTRVRVRVPLVNLSSAGADLRSAWRKSVQRYGY